MAASPHTQQQSEGSAPVQGGPDGYREVAETGDYYGILARGLPYDATKNEVAEFFSGCRIRNGHDGIQILVGQDGRLQGEAVIELEGQEDLDKAKQLNNQMMGRRYIEISPLSQAAADQTLAGQPGGSGTEFVVRLRGLPYSATSREILDLLSDCQVAGGDKGIRFSFAPDGRPSGEAFVELVSEEDVSKALGHNKEHMGKRYVEIFRATKGQLEWEGRMAEKVGGGAGGVVRLRGLPFKCTEEDIRQFFQDMPIVAGGVTMQVDTENRGTGEAYVEFVRPEDAEKALYKNRQMMGHRYIEVFRSTHTEVRPTNMKDTRWRGTPYSRPPPPQWEGGDRGGYGGYGGYGAGGYGGKFGGGYDRGGRGRGRGMMRGGGGYNNYGDAGGGPGYTPYTGGGYNYNTPQPGYGQYDSEYSGGGPGGGGDDPGHMVAYPPIRPTQGGRGGLDDPGEKARHTVKIRGLPYSAKEDDVTKFFQPHVPAKVVVEFDQFQRPSGSAEVWFNTHEEAEKAMDKHNGHMGHRYIELFLLSRPGNDGGEGGRDGGGEGEYGGRGGATGATRYPPQTSWGDTRSAQPQGMYGGSAVASQQQPQQYVQPSYGGYQQQQQQQQPAQPQATQQWPQQGGYQSSGGYQQGAQQPSYQPQSGYQTQTQPVSGYQQPPPTAQDGYSQQPQTQWY